MTNNLIHDRGRGPEIIGTRFTVYNLLPYFTDPKITEEYICRVNNLTPEQVAAARAYVFEHADSVLDEHLKIEAKISQGNPLEVIDHAQRARATLQQFRIWFDEYRAEKESWAGRDSNLPSFRDWVAARKVTAQEQS